MTMGNSGTLGDIRITQVNHTYPFLVEQYAWDRWNLVCMCMSQETAEFVAHACMAAVVIGAREHPNGLAGIAQDIRETKEKQV